MIGISTFITIWFSGAGLVMIESTAVEILEELPIIVQEFMMMIVFHQLKL